MYASHRFLLLLSLSGLLIFTGTSSAGQGEYPRSDLLIEPSELARPEVAERFIVLDVRERSKYEEGHIPGAVWVDHGAWAKSFGMGDDPEDWSRRIGDLGIGEGARVVVHDDNHGKDAARVWWILRYWGVDDARLLNGQWVGWETEDHPIEAGAVEPRSVKFTAKARTDRLATKSQLLESLKRNGLQLVDSRSEAEYCGVEPLRNKRAGAIPGAKHLEWIDLVDRETQKIKSAESLREIFGEAGIRLDRPTATYCQSGGRASVMAFGFELMGAPDVSNYYASWAEWSAAEDAPIEVKERK